MNANINTKLHGIYIIENAQREEICRTENIITDHGMNRLVGNFVSDTTTQNWNRAFINNTLFIIIGKQIAPTLPSRLDFQLQDRVSSGFVRTNEPTITKTVIDTSSTSMTIKFIRGQKFVFNTTLTSPITEVGCHHNESTFINTTFDGIFSRALLPIPISISSGTELFIRYELTITTNCNEIITDDGGDRLKFHYIPPAIPLPDSKTTVQYCPFYRLLTDGSPEHTLNDEIHYNYGDEFNGENQIEKIPPLFEDFGLNNNYYVGDQTSWGDTVGTGSKRYWWIAQCNGANDQSYSSMSSRAVFYFGNNSAGTTAAHRFGNYSSLTLNPFSRNPTVTNGNIITASPASNFWQRKLRFLFSPGNWNTTFTQLHLYSATPARYMNLNSGAARGSIITAFDGGYNAYTNDPNIFVGFEYTFNFTRSGGGTYAS